MRCESDALRNLERTTDTGGAVRRRPPVKAHEPDTSGRHVSVPMGIVIVVTNAK